MTPWSASARPPACSGSADQAVLAVCYPAAIVALGLAGWLVGREPGSTRRWLAGGAARSADVIGLDIDDPAHCLRLFRANREVGLAVGMALLMGWL